MLRKMTLTAALTLLAGAATADSQIDVQDPYARSSNAMAGAAFMTIRNTGTTDDRLSAAQSDIAQRVELHTHIADGDGVMRMVKIEDGIAVEAGAEVLLQRGGLHVMFMGLDAPMENGETVSVTLVFEEAGEIPVEIPVDLDRMPAAMTHGDS